MMIGLVCSWQLIGAKLGRNGTLTYNRPKVIWRRRESFDIDTTRPHLHCTSSLWEPSISNENHFLTQVIPVNYLRCKYRLFLLPVAGWHKFLTWIPSTYFYIRPEYGAIIQIMFSFSRCSRARHYVSSCFASVCQYICSSRNRLAYLAAFVHDWKVIWSRDQQV
jgi:hypothetical protein